MNENQICSLEELKSTLISCVCTEISKGIENVDTHELGEVIDMIKDISEAEYYCTLASKHTEETK